MSKRESNFGFKVMAVEFKIRDLLFPRRNILKEVGIEPGFQVLDYGCGPGNYIVPLRELVGAAGRIHALDIHPLAIRSIRSIIAKRQLANVQTIRSDYKTGLPDDSIDVALLYDILHDLDDPKPVMGELHRVLKPGGILSLRDHHLKEKEIVSRVTEGGLFRLSGRGKKTYSFSQ